MDELKKCPFCGGEASVGQGIMDSTNHLLWEVECLKCGVMTIGHVEKQDAIAAWNRRKGNDYGY